MQEFDTLEQLLDAIRHDYEAPASPSAQRYPARLIFLPSLRILNALAKALDAVPVHRCELSDALPHDDGWFTEDRLLNTIKALPVQRSHLVVPFSEVVRFFPDDKLRSVLNCLTTDIENAADIPKNRRIYLPMVGIYERVEGILRDLHRHHQQEWAPIWSVKGETEKISVYFFRLPLPAQTEQVHVIHSTKQWLNFWKNPERAPLICISKTLNHHYTHSQPDHAFELRPITTFPELIATIRQTQIPIPHDAKDQPHWEALWKSFQNAPSQTFEDIVTHAVNRKTIRPDEMASLWLAQSNLFTKWLLKWFALSQTAWETSYIAHIFRDLAACDSQAFINALWLKIFDSTPISAHWIQERKALLQSISGMPGVNTAEIETLLRHRLNAIPDLFQHIELLTGITAHERRLAIGIVKERAKAREQAIAMLQPIYPQLADYLADIVCDGMTPEQTWVREYFNEYRWSKVLHDKTARLTQLLAEKNANKDAFYTWYYAFPSAHSSSFFERIPIKNVFWIDGLGIEWLPLLTRLIEAHGLIVEKKFLARANLPTTTLHNRFDQATPLRELDAFIHGKTHYAHPDDLIREIEIVAEIVNNSLLTNERILVVSDHGFTAFALADFDNRKKYTFDNADHDGRCLTTDAEFLDDVDFVVHAQENGEQQKKTVIALRHVSLYNVPKREAHGGATPEEVLVPVIVIAKHAADATETYTVTPLEQTVPLKEPVLKLTIQPTPNVRPKLRHANTMIELEYDASHNIWKANMTHVKAGKYEDALEIGTWRSRLTFIIKGGMQTKDFPL